MLVWAPLNEYVPVALGDTEPQNEPKEVGVNKARGVDVASKPMEGVPLELPPKGVNVLQTDPLGAHPEVEGSKEAVEAGEGEIDPTTDSVAPWQGEGRVVTEAPPVKLPLDVEEVHSVKVPTAEGEMEGAKDGVEMEVMEGMLLMEEERLGDTLAPFDKLPYGVVDREGVRVEEGVFAPPREAVAEEDTDATPLALPVPPPLDPLPQAVGERDTLHTGERVAVLERDTEDVRVPLGVLDPVRDPDPLPLTLAFTLALIPADTVPLPVGVDVKVPLGEGEEVPKVEPLLPPLPVIPKADPLTTEVGVPEPTPEALNVPEVVREAVGETVSKGFNVGVVVVVEEAHKLALGVTLTTPEELGEVDVVKNALWVPLGVAVTHDVDVAAPSVALGPIVRVLVGLEVPVPVIDREGEGEKVPHAGVPVTLREAFPERVAKALLVGVPEELAEGLGSPLGVVQEVGLPEWVPPPLPTPPAEEGVTEVVVVWHPVGDTVPLVLLEWCPLLVLHRVVEGEGVDVRVPTVHLVGVFVEDIVGDWVLVGQAEEVVEELTLPPPLRPPVPDTLLEPVELGVEESVGVEVDVGHTDTLGVEVCVEEGEEVRVFTSPVFVRVGVNTGVGVMVPLPVPPNFVGLALVDLEGV